MRGRFLAIICACFLVSASAAPAFSNDLFYDVKIGVLAHDVPDLWSGTQLESDAADINFEVMFNYGLPFLGGVIRPAVGASINTDGATSQVYFDARWQIELNDRLFFATGLGVAVHDGKLKPTKADMKALGSTALFHIPLELGFRFDEHNSVSIWFEHISNAGLADHNEGLDRIGVRYGYRF